jgi:hypothetical protein
VYRKAHKRKRITAEHLQLGSALSRVAATSSVPLSRSIRWLSVEAVVGGFADLAFVDFRPVALACRLFGG